jgi:hypothetical protein
MAVRRFGFWAVFAFRPPDLIAVNEFSSANLTFLGVLYDDGRGSNLISEFFREWIELDELLLLLLLQPLFSRRSANLGIHDGDSG